MQLLYQLGSVHLDALTVVTDIGASKTESCNIIKIFSSQISSLKNIDTIEGVWLKYIGVIKQKLEIFIKDVLGLITSLLTGFGRFCWVDIA